MGTMRVKVRLFAMLRERAGSSEIELALPEGARVADALELLANLSGGLPLVMAVNRVYAREDVVLEPGDELALIPPVSGGQDQLAEGRAPSSPPGAVRHARITAQALSADRLLSRVGDPRAGALVSFSGVTREVQRLEYEAYREMAEPELERILAAVVARHGLCAAAAEHRVGPVPLGEASVVVAVSAPHRSEAFAGARAAIDEIKSRAPIWKREVEGGRREWVAGTPPGS